MLCVARFPDLYTSGAGVTGPPLSAREVAELGGRWWAGAWIESPAQAGGEVALTAQQATRPRASMSHRPDTVSLPSVWAPFWPEWFREAGRQSKAA
jgi:hypothetical protein